jgi:hypothetical protein
MWGVKLIFFLAMLNLLLLGAELVFNVWAVRFFWE